jgi:hypothetical protein
MSHIEIECIGNNDNDNDNDKISKFKDDFYPAILVRQLGIDKGKGQGLGYYFLLYCLGLGQLLGQSVGCAFLTL